LVSGNVSKLNKGVESNMRVGARERELYSESLGQSPGGGPDAEPVVRGKAP